VNQTPEGSSSPSRGRGRGGSGFRTRKGGSHRWGSPNQKEVTSDRARKEKGREARRRKKLETFTSRRVRWKQNDASSRRGYLQNGLGWIVCSGGGAFFRRMEGSLPGEKENKRPEQKGERGAPAFSAGPTRQTCPKRSKGGEKHTASRKGNEPKTRDRTVPPGKGGDPRRGELVPPLNKMAIDGDLNVVGKQARGTAQLQVRKAKRARI